MTDDLVTEARKGGPCAELGDRCRAIEAASGCFCAAVADRIEALTAERDALIAQRDAVPFDTDALGMGLEMAAQSTIRIVTKERDEALADNARLREALAMIDAIDPEYRIDGCAQAVVRGLVLRMGEVARAALIRKGDQP